MLKKISLFLILCLIPATPYAVEITPSDVYREVHKIHDEIEIIKSHFDIKEDLQEGETLQVNTNIQPRHSWQKSYLVMVKVNVLRRNLKFPRIEEIGIEPLLNLDPRMMYGITQRVLAELRIVKDFLGIKEVIGKAPRFENKKPVDVFNYMHHISIEMDILNGSQAIPSDTYSQTRRLFDDIDSILAHLEINDKTIPPAKHMDATPIEEYRAVFELMEVIQAIYKKIGLEITDFSPFKMEKPEPSDVLNMVALTIGELQPIKAFLGMENDVTPAAKYYKNKIRADVEQLVRWNTDRMKLIRDSGKF